MEMEESLKIRADEDIPDISWPGAYNCQLLLTGVVNKSLYSPGDSLSLFTLHENAVLSWENTAMTEQ
jgi:hypothetical protein